MSQTRTYLCEESSNYLDNLFNRLKLRIPSVQIRTLYKISFTRGLINLPPRFEKFDSKGKEIRVDPFESLLFDAIIRQKFKMSVLVDKNSYYKAAIDLGALLIKAEDEGDEFALLNNIIRGFKLPVQTDEKTFNYGIESAKGSSKPLKIILGRYINDEDVKIMWNDKNHTGQHMGIAGKTGSGKTQFILDVASQISEESSNKVSIIYLDYAKGDVAANEKFIDIINGEAIDIANTGLPFNPFHLDVVDDLKIEELKEIFCSIQKSLGPKQSLALFYILKNVYATYKDVDLECVYKSIIDTYESEGKQMDVLVELFHKLDVPKIFPSSGSGDELTDLLGRSIVFDLHRIDSNMKIKELVTFLILNKIYTEAIKLPDSEIDPKTDTRQMRSMIIIDEAHNYLNCENRVLEKMLRELRSKGVAVVLLTQGYIDFNQKNFDYSSMLGWTFIMKSDNSYQEIGRALAVDGEKAKELAKELALAEVGKVYTRTMNPCDEEYCFFNANLFWKRYN